MPTVMFSMSRMVYVRANNSFPPVQSLCAIKLQALDYAYLPGNARKFIF